MDSPKQDCTVSSSTHFVYNVGSVEIPQDRGKIQVQEMYVVLTTLLLLSVSCDCARILVLTPFPGRSHWIVMEPFFQELAARGHQLTVFSTFPQKKPLANYTDVDFSSQLPPLVSTFSIEIIKEKMPNPFHTAFFMNELHSSTCKVIELPQFQQLLKAKGQYDLLITEVFGNDCFAYFAHILDIPLISITTSVNVPWGSERVGLPDNPSYIPNYLVDFSSNMNLWERLYNTIVLSFTKYYHLHVFSKHTQSMVEKALGINLPPINDVVGKTSLLLVNSHYALAQSRPFPPNVVEIGGIHIKKRQPLSEDIQKILDNAKQGAIIMSFGSLVRAATLPKAIIMSFMRAFSKIPQTIIFKYEEDLPEAPPNVIVKKWLSQRDLMEHENVVAMIAHGGLASTVEAVYFGKPIIGIPFFADQSVNINSVTRRGGGIMLDLTDISEEKISRALSEILNNSEFSKNMKLLSQQFKDRPMTPLQSAVYWTEYVIKYKGAYHLRPASVDLPLYQYLLLDVVVVLLGCLLAVISILYLVFKFVKSLFTKRVVDKVTNKKKTS